VTLTTVYSSHILMLKRMVSCSVHMSVYRDKNTQPYNKPYLRLCYRPCDIYKYTANTGILMLLS